MPSRGEAFEFLVQEGPRIFGTGVGSMLYVGHRPDTTDWWHRKFAPAIGAAQLAVIDIIHPNLMTAGHITSELYHGDIGDPKVVPREFGLVFWDEGPEHVAQEDALLICQALALRHGRVLISCPWGFQSQGDNPKDPEFHHWGPLPEHFQGIGWEARTFGQIFPDGHGNLIAWSP